jgi:hypothetical protein
LEDCSTEKESVRQACAILVSLLAIAIALPIADVIITILDRSQITKIKQFDDISYLI